MPQARPWAQGEWGKTVQFCFVKTPGTAGHWVGLPAVGSGAWISGELQEVSAFVPDWDGSGKGERPGVRK